MGGLGARGSARRRRFDGAGRPAVVELRGGGAPVKEGWRGLVGKLRGGWGTDFEGYLGQRRAGEWSSAASCSRWR